MIEGIARGTAAAVAAAVLVCPVKAQTVADRIGEIRDGAVRMSFAARDGVCGRGDRTRIVSRTKRSDERWSGCDAGLIRVALYLVDGTVVDLETHVGGRWRSGGGGVDLGTVPALEAADYLMTLAAVVDSDPGKEAVFAASLADSATVWPELERLARDRSRPEEIRRQAIFWMGHAVDDDVVDALTGMLGAFSSDRLNEHVVMALSQHGGPRVADVLQDLAVDETASVALRGRAVFWLGQMKESTPALIELYDRLESTELRERVIFAYAHKRNDEDAMEELMALARSETNGELRGKAIFWLGQVRDPRAVQFLAELINR